MKENTNIFERILHLADLKGIKNIPELAIYLGYDNPEKLYRLKRTPGAKPSIDMIEDFSNKFEDLNLRWLLTDIGEPLISPRMSYTITRRATDNIDSNTESNEHVAGRLKRGNSNKNVSPTVSPTTKNVGWNDVHGIAKKEYLIPQFITVDNNGSQNILYVPVRARAGYLLGYGDPEYLSDLTSFSLPGLSGGTYRSFEVEGNSMEPTLKNKELIIGEWVESLEHIRDDRVHIVVTKTDGIVIKRLLNRISEYGYVVAKSDAVDNRADYPNLNIYPEDILEVWYAVWHGGFDFKGPAEMYKRVNNLEADITEVMRLLKEAGLKQ